MESFYPKSQKEWRKWLMKNHASHDSVWLTYYKKASNIPSITHSEAVDEALCFGWIDSVRQSVDEESFRQFFGKRKAKSTWSRVNKEKIRTLIENGKMQPAGLDSIAKAKKNGSWTILDKVERLLIPKDLAAAFAKHAGARKNFLSLSRSVRRALLLSLAMAKRPETRAVRVAVIINKMME